MVNADEDPGAKTRRGSFPFDPVRGAALFNEIQAEGLRAAGTLVERLIHLVDGSPTTDGQDRPADPAGEPTSVHSPTNPELSAILPWFELWRDLVERTSETLQRFGGAGSSPNGDHVRVGIDGSLAPVRPLTISVDSEQGQGEMWLHNGTPTDHAALVPQCGSLCDSDGNRLECEVEIDPPKIDGLPARSSRGFAISVVVGTSSAAGTYRGVVQVGGAEAVWMPIEVTVPMRSST